tara:strand:+ start:33298 stop:33657 length:360 start_codon:yes stop_codon:yes gene_type:complete
MYGKIMTSRPCILPNLKMTVNPDVYLYGSIALEVLSTTGLKKTLINKIWYIPVYCGYGVSFYIFPKALSKYSLSYAYTLWCAIGIILTSAVDIIFYNELLTLRKILGILIIISGIKVVK